MINRRVFRYGVVSLALDFTTYVIWAVLPFQALAMASTATVLGVIPALSGLAYSVTTALTGGVTDRARSYRIGALGCVLVAGACLMELEARSLFHLALGTIPLGIGTGFLWPAVQAGIGRASAADELSRNVGFFNIMWSLGKGFGLVIGGSLFDYVDGATALGLAGLLTVVFGLILPADATGAAPAPTAAAPAPWPDARRFMTAAWLANFAAWGIGATVLSQYPKLVETLPHPAVHFGWFNGVLYLSQTVTFAWLGRWNGWIGRARLLFAAEAVGAVAMLLLPACAGGWSAYALAPLLGGVLGLCYVSSIYYSLRAGGQSQGRMVGWHEAILSSSNILVPVVGGWVSTHAGWPAAPFFLAAVVMVVVMAIQRWRVGIA